MIEPSDGTESIYGTEGAGTEFTVRGRIERTQKLMVVNGLQSVIAARIFLPPGTNIKRENQVTIDGEKMLVLDIGKVTHGDGSEHHIEVLCGARTGASV